MSLFSQVKSTTVMRRIKSRRKNPLAPHRSRRNLLNHPTLNPRSLPRINLPNRTAGRPTASHPRPLATASKVLSHHRYWEIWSWKTDGFFCQILCEFPLKKHTKKIELPDILPICRPLYSRDDFRDQMVLHRPLAGNLQNPDKQIQCRQVLCILIYLFYPGPNSLYITATKI